jgi:hypothetical protein
MKFTLQYSGPLPPSGTPADKQLIRRAFHSQLKKVWLNHPTLSLYAEGRRALSVASLDGGLRIKIENSLAHYQPWQNNMCGVPLNGFEFAPLVLRDNALSCELNVKFLRRGRPGDVSKGGDLDNRLKTLLDGLQIPHRENQLGGDTPATEKERLYCLLEDDSLITRIAVDADELLSDEPNATAVLYIEVTLASYLD